MPSDDVRIRQLEQQAAAIEAKLATCDDRPWPVTSNEKVPPQDSYVHKPVSVDPVWRADANYHGDYYRG